MPEVIFYNEVFLNRTFAKKLCYAIDCAAASMGKDECLRISFVDDVIVVETKGLETTIKLGANV